METVQSQIATLYIGSPKQRDMLNKATSKLSQLNKYKAPIGHLKVKK